MKLKETSMKIVCALLASVVLAFAMGACETSASAPHKMGAMANPGAQQSFVVTVQAPTVLSTLMPPQTAMPAGTLAGVANDAGTVVYYYYNPMAVDASSYLPAAPGGYWVPLFNDAGLGSPPH
jgi:hypothetical protein